jgi:hypothetical protein
VMLIAKYVKVFSRTGTPPFLLGWASDWDFGPSTPRPWEQFLAHWYPRDNGRRILRIKNILGVLAYSHGNHALLDSVHGFGKTLDILSSPWQAFSTPTAEGQRDS